MSRPPIVFPIAWWQAPLALDEWKDTSKYRPHESGLKRSIARASAVRYLRRSDTNESGSGEQIGAENREGAVRCDRLLRASQSDARDYKRFGARWSFPGNGH